MKVAIAGLIVLAATVAAYSGVAGQGFVIFDDPDYVRDNALVKGGLTAESVAWAMTARVASNWHPLTWLSLMLDSELFGSSPKVHKLVNVALHAANAVLLFALLVSMTRRARPSLFAASLFALHPVHVESVAWISERKDVLSGLFFFLAIIAYAAYARRGGAGRYVFVVALFVLGLAAKQMLVTLPAILLLLDAWPLGRWRPGGPLRNVRLLLEKIPLVLAAFASGLLTLSSQESGFSVASLGALPLGARLANAAVSYARYLGHLLFPFDLALVYPHPGLLGGPGWPAVAVAGSLVLLVAITVLALRSARPHLAVGWLWYLVTMLPVIGLVQVGVQAMADRYAYLTFVGLYVAIAWGAADLFAGARIPAAGAGLAAAAVLATLSVRTADQVGLWKESVGLFEHTIEVTGSNPHMHFGLGCAYGEMGPERFSLAEREFRKAVELAPDHPQARYWLGYVLEARGARDEAIEEYERSSLALPAWDAPREALERLRSPENR